MLLSVPFEPKQSEAPQFVIQHFDDERHANSRDKVSIKTKEARRP
jgi:hypothetical protein